MPASNKLISFVSVATTLPKLSGAFIALAGSATTIDLTIVNVSLKLNTSAVKSSVGPSAAKLVVTLNSTSVSLSTAPITSFPFWYFINLYVWALNSISLIAQPVISVWVLSFIVIIVVKSNSCAETICSWFAVAVYVALTPTLNILTIPYFV